MTGPTHKQYSICFAFLAVMIIEMFGITEVDYYLTLMIVLMASKVGALFPDLDHDWSNVSNSSKTVPNRVINFLIHVTGGKHRSWQTHSIDICTVFTVCAFILPKKLCSIGILSVIDKEVLSVLILGFASGWVSHLFSDMLTSAGVRLLFFIKKPIALVPKKIGKFRFNTGHEWEAFNYKIIKGINIFLGVVCLLYPLFLDGRLDILINLIQ